MRSRQVRLIEALNRVEEFLARNGALMQGVISSAAHEHFSASRARITEYVKAQQENERASRASTVAKRKLRKRLVRNHMQPIEAIARVQLPAVPELEALTVPPRNRQYTILVAAAHGMARAAATYHQTFLTAGLAPDFIEKLVAAADALDEAITERGQVKALRVRATAGLTKEGLVARGHLRVLDRLVLAAVEDDDVLLDHWRDASRVGAPAKPRTPTEPAGPGGSDEAPPAPSPAPSPTEVQPAL